MGNDDECVLDEWVGQGGERGGGGRGGEGEREGRELNESGWDGYIFKCPSFRPKRPCSSWGRGGEGEGRGDPSLYTLTTNRRKREMALFLCFYMQHTVVSSTYVYVYSTLYTPDMKNIYE